MCISLRRCRGDITLRVMTTLKTIARVMTTIKQCRSASGTYFSNFLVKSTNTPLVQPKPSISP